MVEKIISNLSLYCVKHSKYLALFKKFIKNGDQDLNISVFKSMYDDLVIYSHIFKKNDYNLIKTFFFLKI